MDKILTTEPPVQQIKDKNNWYREHKDEPEVREAYRAASRRFYYKNQEEEKKRCLARYYAKKGTTMPEGRRPYNRKVATDTPADLKN
jgi:hypothetical protein